MNPSKLQIAKKLSLITTDEEFNSLASELCQIQQDDLPVYRQFVQQTNGRSGSTPMLPIELFKHYEIGPKSAAEISFKSSGTTGERSSHHVASVDLYKQLSALSFESHFGKLTNWVILALLPSYLENGDSSLVFMVHHFIESTKNSKSCFVANERDLEQYLTQLKEENCKTMIIGVSYALLDFASNFAVDWSGLHIMETGGMKGRKKELTRSELHATLRSSFPSSCIHSEYGMTELLSQAYAVNGNIFQLPPWAKVSATSVSDPFQTLQPGQRGLLAFIDLANVYGCAFIQTRDLGIVHENGTFTVEGRLDHSDIRGCNLLYT